MIYLDVHKHPMVIEWTREEKVKNILIDDETTNGFRTETDNSNLLYYNHKINNNILEIVYYIDPQINRQKSKICLDLYDQPIFIEWLREIREEKVKNILK